MAKVEERVKGWKGKMGFAKLIHNNNDNKILYHYTSQSGLMGIARSKCIWASHLYYLNDTTEFVHAFDLMYQKIEPLHAGVGSNAMHWKYNFYPRVKDALQSYKLLPSQIGLFVCSFSEDGDLLSQWRGYCPDGYGYSIGFNSSRLKKKMAGQDFVLHKCEYDPKVQDAMLSKILDKMEVEADKVFAEKHVYDDNKLDDVVFKNLIIPLILVAPLMKNAAFREEKEWRLVSTIINTGEGEVNFRNGKSSIIPYYDFKLSNKDTLEIDEIKVSPSMNSKLAIESIKGFLKSEKVSVNKISPSIIPYRGY